jgi:hypothetical protein
LYLNFILRANLARLAFVVLLVLLRKLGPLGSGPLGEAVGLESPVVVGSEPPVVVGGDPPVLPGSEMMPVFVGSLGPVVPVGPVGSDVPVGSVDGAVDGGWIAVDNGAEGLLEGAVSTGSLSTLMPVHPFIIPTPPLRILASPHT